MIVDALGSPTIADDLKSFDKGFGRPDPDFDLAVQYAVSHYPGSILSQSFGIPEQHSTAITVNLNRRMIIMRGSRPGDYPAGIGG
jgi:hypothetical protein